MSGLTVKFGITSGSQQGFKTETLQSQISTSVAMFSSHNYGARAMAKFGLSQTNNMTFSCLHNTGKFQVLSHLKFIVQECLTIDKQN